MTERALSLTSDQLTPGSERHAIHTHDSHSVISAYSGQWAENSVRHQVYPQVSYHRKDIWDTGTPEGRSDGHQ